MANSKKKYKNTTTYLLRLVKKKNCHSLQCFVYMVISNVFYGFSRLCLVEVKNAEQHEIQEITFHEKWGYTWTETAGQILFDWTTWKNQNTKESL